jgi:hypothetical protein
MNDHIAIIKEQNDPIAKFAKIVEHEIENENFKFACSMLYNGRRPDIKDEVSFQPRSQNNIKFNIHRNKISNFVRGKAPMVQDRECYISYDENYPEHKNRRMHAKKSHHVARHAYIYKNEASSSKHIIHIKMPKKKIVDASNEHSISFKTFYA